MESGHYLIVTACLLTVFRKVFQILVRNVHVAFAPTPSAIGFVALADVIGTAFVPVFVIVAGAVAAAAVPAPPVLLSAAAGSAALRPAKPVPAVHAGSARRVLFLHGHLDPSPTGGHGGQLIQSTGLVQTLLRNDEFAIGSASKQQFLLGRWQES
jgi:hypothetical protein